VSVTYEPDLRKRIRVLTAIFIIGLVLSGATAIPLVAEVDYLVKLTGSRELQLAPRATPAPVWALWLTKVQDALHSVADKHPFLFYGTDWLAFGHFVIAIAFIGALRDPARNEWLFTFGMIACALVVPYALIFGAIRGVPFYWRMIDCSFGIFGIIPIWLCRKWARKLADNSCDSRNESSRKGV